MDTRPCYYPNYSSRGYYEPSHWPLSNVRSSMSSHDDSSEPVTFEEEWVGNHSSPIPYQQRTIRNLTGRSFEESFALKRRRSSSCSGSGSLSPLTPPCDGATPQYLLRNECPPQEMTTSTSAYRSGDQAMKTNETRSESPTHSMVVDLVTAIETNVEPKTPLRDDIIQPNSDSPRQQQKLKVGIQEQANIKASSTAVPIDDVRVSIRRPITPQPPHLRRHEASISVHEPGPSATMSQSLSKLHIMDVSAKHPTSLSKNRTVLPTLPSQGRSEALNEDDDESFSPNRSAKGKKSKLNEHSLPSCEICHKTFTRNFDLMRHNQKHQVESEDEKIRRTCPNCERVLSRVDAAKRHVDTLPESCNYIRRKQSLKPLPAMPLEYYINCKAKYHRLAEERKKPKGRKKANRAS